MLLAMGFIVVVRIHQFVHLFVEITRKPKMKDAMMEISIMEMVALILVLLKVAGYALVVHQPVCQQFAETTS